MKGKGNGQDGFSFLPSKFEKRGKKRTGRTDFAFSLPNLKKEEKENGQDASCPFSFSSFSFFEFLIEGLISRNFALPYFDIEHERF
jgi:hypothetical protein